MQAVAMTVAPDGPRMRRDPACGNPNRPPSPNTFRRLSAGSGPVAQNSKACGTWKRSIVDGQAVGIYHGVTMHQFASLFAALRLPVLDHTKLAGAFDFTFTLPLENLAGLTPEQADAARARASRARDKAFRAQLGLVTDFSNPTKLPVPVLVIDRVEKPTAN